MLPHYLAIGVSKREFFKSTPKMLKAYDKANNLRLKQQDEQMWIMGQYVLSAVAFAVEHCLAGKKAKTEYIDRPMMAAIDIGGNVRDKKEMEIGDFVARLDRMEANFKNKK